MKSLTGLDATFLYLETPEMPMHVGSLNLCELPAGFKGSFQQAVTRHIGQRMHLAPVFSRKLVFMPLDLGHPLWVDAGGVDLGFHIRRADPDKKGAATMTLAQVHALCAQLHGELIDRNFPLWEFYIFDRIRLPDGRVVAGFFSKIHHAALDGKGGVMLANAMLDLGPVPREVAPPDPNRRPKTAADLSTGKMLGAVFSSSLGQLAKAARALPLAATTLGKSLGASLARPAMDAALPGKRGNLPMKLAPATPFNAGIGSGRVFVTATVPLADCKAMGKSLGASFNDVVLWLCATALRDYLAQHHTLPKKSLVAAMPVSLREAGASGAGELGNQVSMSLVELGTHLANPLKRMNAIMASTGKVKSAMQGLKGLLPTDYPSLLAPWLVGGAGRLALNAYGKSGLASRLPMVANLAISNVPGPPVPLYLAGARFMSFHPLSIIMHGLALNITIQTYAGQVDFGIVADRKALPHADDLARAIEHAFAQARDLTGLTMPAPPEDPKPAPKTAARTVRKPAPKTVTAVPARTPATQRAARKPTPSAAPKPDQKPVPRATRAATLEKSPSAKRARRTDTVTVGTNTRTSNAPSHGKNVDTAPATPARRSTPPRRPAQRTAAGT